MYVTEVSRRVLPSNWTPYATLYIGISRGSFLLSNPAFTVYFFIPLGLFAVPVA